MFDLCGLDAGTLEMCSLRVHARKYFLFLFCWCVFGSGPMFEKISGDPTPEQHLCQTGLAFVRALKTTCRALHGKILGVAMAEEQCELRISINEERRYDLVLRRVQPDQIRVLK